MSKPDTTNKEINATLKELKSLADKMNQACKKLASATNNLPTSEISEFLESVSINAALLSRTIENYSRAIK